MLEQRNRPPALPEGAVDSADRGETQPVEQVTDAPERFARQLRRAAAFFTGLNVRMKIIGMALLVIIPLGLAIVWQVRGVLNDALVAELDSRAKVIALDLVNHLTGDDTPAGREQMRALLEDTLSVHPDARYAFVVAASGEVLAHTMGEEGVPPALLSLHGMEPTPEPTHAHYSEVEIGKVHSYRAFFAGGERSVTVGLSEEKVTTVLGGLTVQIWVTTAFAAGVAIAGAGLLTWLLTRPIADLVKSTRRVAEGDLSERATVWANDEIGHLASSFNEMVEDLEVSRDALLENERARTRLLNQLITAQEEERRRISRELHDTVGQALNSLILEFSLLPEEGDVDSRWRADVTDLASTTLAQVRQMSRELRPSVLDDLGLEVAIQRYADDARQQYPELTIDVHADVGERLSPPVEIALYRVVQEAMTNVGRHAEARHLSVLVARIGDKVRAIIEDDGKGFDPTRAMGVARSVGLHGMRERAEILGGLLRIESSPAGSSVIVEVPA